MLLAFGLDANDLRTILRDFPLLDRGQPALSGESHSSITRDLTLATTGRIIRSRDAIAEERVAIARSLGALPFIPAEYAASPRTKETDASFDFST